MIGVDAFGIYTHSTKIAKLIRHCPVIFLVHSDAAQTSRARVKLLTATTHITCLISIFFVQATGSSHFTHGLDPATVLYSLLRAWFSSAAISSSQEGKEP